MSLWLESSLTSVRKLADEAVGRIFPTDKKSDQRIEQLEKYVRKALENIPFEMYLFAGTAILYCASRRLLRNNDNNNDSSSPSNDTRRQLTAEELEWEAIIHAQKKQSNYKDPSLQAVMSAMSETKKKLRQVENPEEARKQKLKTLKVQAKSKATTALGISEESLQGKLSSLKKVEKDSSNPSKESDASDSYLKEWRNRLRNVAVN
jgi:hypothetical protein